MCRGGEIAGATIYTNGRKYDSYKLTLERRTQYELVLGHIPRLLCLNTGSWI